MEQDIYTEEYYKVRAYTCGNIGLQEHFRIVAQCIKEKLNPQWMLDVGCARGYLVAALRTEGIQAFGIDISQYALESCPEDAKLFVSLGNANDIPFCDGTFDLVTCFECLEHVDNPSIVAAQISRVVVKGGCVLCSSPRVTFWRILFNLIFGQAEVHPSELPLWEWIRIFRDAGLEYAGDFAEIWGISRILHDLTVRRTAQMIPCTRLGKFLNRLGTGGKWLRVMLNVLAWQSEYMMFRKI